MMRRGGLERKRDSGRECSVETEVTLHVSTYSSRQSVFTFPLFGAGWSRQGLRQEGVRIGNKRHRPVAKGVLLELTPRKGVRTRCLQLVGRKVKGGHGEAKVKALEDGQQKTEYHSQDLMIDKTKLECSEEEAGKVQSIKR